MRIEQNVKQFGLTFISLCLGSSASAISEELSQVLDFAGRQQHVKHLLDKRGHQMQVCRRGFAHWSDCPSFFSSPAAAAAPPPIGVRLCGINQSISTAKETKTNSVACRVHMHSRTRTQKETKTNSGACGVHMN